MTGEATATPRTWFASALDATAATTAEIKQAATRRRARMVQEGAACGPVTIATVDRWTRAEFAYMREDAAA